MPYHDQARELGQMIKAYGLKPEQLNIMIRFAKLVRRSAKQNKVLWNIVNIMLEDTPMKLTTYEKERKDGGTYEAWRVEGTIESNPELIQQIESQEAS